MLRDVIRFEWRYHTRQVAFAVGVALFLGLGYALPALGYGPSGTHLNSPFVVMQSVGLLSLLGIFVLFKVLSAASSSASFTASRSAPTNSTARTRRTRSPLRSARICDLPHVAAALGSAGSPVCADPRATGSP